MIPRMIQIILLLRLLPAKFNFITPTNMKHKIYLVLLGLLAICLNTMAQTPRTEIATVTATSNIADILGVDKEPKRPDFTITTSEGAKPYISVARWMKKTEADEWVNYDETTFTPGIYRMDIQMDIWSKTYKLATDWSLTMDGVNWETEPAHVIDETSSYGNAHSPEFMINKEVTAVSATSDIMDIIGYAKQKKTPK